MSASNFIVVGGAPLPAKLADGTAAAKHKGKPPAMSAMALDLSGDAPAPKACSRHRASSEMHINLKPMAGGKNSKQQLIFTVGKSEEFHSSLPLIASKSRTPSLRSFSLERSAKAWDSCATCR